MRGWAIGVGVGVLWLATACGTASPPAPPTPASTVAAPRPPAATATNAPPATATRSAEGTPVIRIVSTTTAPVALLSREEAIGAVLARLPLDRRTQFRAHVLAEPSGSDWQVWGSCFTPGDARWRVRGDRSVQADDGAVTCEQHLASIRSTATASTTPFPSKSVLTVYRAYTQLTEIRRPGFERDAVGKPVFGDCSIQDVQEDGKISLDCGEGSSGSIYVEGVSPSETIRFRRGQRVQFTAQIKQLKMFGFHFVYLEDFRALQ